MDKLFDPPLPNIPLSTELEYQTPALHEEIQSMQAENVIDESSDSTDFPIGQTLQSSNEEQAPISSQPSLKIDTNEEERNRQSSLEIDNNEEGLACDNPPRRSNKNRRIPSKLQDYFCDSVIRKGSSPHMLSKVISYDNLSSSHKAFTMAVTSTAEPRGTPLDDPELPEVKLGGYYISRQQGLNIPLSCTSQSSFPSLKPKSFHPIRTGIVRRNHEDPLQGYAFSLVLPLYHGGQRTDLRFQNPSSEADIRDLSHNSV
nr:Integrase, catalytic core [Ipomoea batatas]